jgi:hypothetical protein
MNFRGLYKWAGLSAIGYAALSLTSYIISIVTNGPRVRPKGLQIKSGICFKDRGTRLTFVLS